MCITSSTYEKLPKLFHLPALSVSAHSLMLEFQSIPANYNYSNNNSSDNNSSNSIIIIVIV